MALISLNLNTPPAERRGNLLENPSVGLGNLGAIWSWISGTEPTASGELIDEHVALQIITVYSCVRLIAETVSSLPLKLYERLPKGRLEAVDNYLHDILTIEPNPEMSAVPFWETVVGCMALTGNSYVYIQRGSAGQVVALWPLNPKMTKPVRMPTNELAYQTTEGFSNGQSKIYQASDILHFKLFSWDGLLGLSPIMLARQSLGLTRAAEKMGARLFANGGRPSGVMTQDGAGSIDEKMLLNLRESWQAAQTGDNALKTAFLPGSWKYTAIGLDMEAVQFLATRMFQRSEIAALYRVPGHLVGDTTRQSNTNSEQEALTLVTLTLRPYLTRIENEIQRVLLPSVGRNANRFFCEFDVRGLLRGDHKTQFETYAIGKQWGFMNTNMILEDQGLNPIGAVGEVYWTPVNMQNSENLLLMPATTAPAEAAPAVDGPTVPTDAERSIVQRASSMTLVFRDAVGRLTKRSQRDLTTIQGIFEPVLRSIALLSVDSATAVTGLQWPDDGAVDRIVRDVCKSIENRAAKWTPETADEVTPDEFRKALRGVVSAVYKELGAASVA
jgi:HK97 family phage portal protein